MSAEVYRDLVFEVQALRRRVERDLHLGGALGVAGTLWPHQVGNVARVLWDTQVRHVLADEVGLGKTVQAIMVLKALILQNPELRVGIVVPDTLKRQWIEELMVRGNIAPITDEPVEGDDRRPMLLWPASPRLADVELGTLDLLIVDELPRLRADLQRRVVAASTTVPRVIVLTATPRLDDAQRAAQLFEILEPDRMALADGAPVAWLRAREAEVRRLLDDGWPQDATADPPPGLDPEAAAQAHSAVRRLLRTRRDVWRDYLPNREPHVHLVEPTGQERKRQALLWRWLELQATAELSREFDVEALAQRVRSPASLRQRVTFLKGKGHDIEGLIERVRLTLDGAAGDSRYEALLDVLSDIWADDPEAKVLVAANDNLTVDDLATRLVRAFDRMPKTEAPLVVGTIRNQTKGVEELIGDDVIAAEATAFREGDTQVLLLAEAGAAGLNLQGARHIVLYAVPWDPEEVDQLIGRIDRIGNPAVGKPGEMLPIAVHVIGQRDLVDERVLAVIQATRLLERSISLDGDAVTRMKARIMEVALRDDGAGWAGLLEEARALGLTGEAEELALPLMEHLPTSPARSYALHRRLVEAPPAPPALAQVAAGEAGWSEATLTWLKAMAGAEKYRMQKLHEPRGERRLFYKLPTFRVASPAELPTRPIGVLPHTGSRVCFRTHRRQLESSPRLFDLEDRTPLYFFDHGSPPHEDMLRAWLTPAKGKKGSIILPKGHPCLHLAGTVVRLWIARLDAAKLLATAGQLGPDLEADRRFLRGLLPSSLVATGAVVRGARAAPLPPADVLALLTPQPGSVLLSKSTSPWSAPPGFTLELAGEADRLAQQQAMSAARERWTPILDGLRHAVAIRRYVLAVDASDADARHSSDKAALRRDLELALAEGKKGQATILARRLEELGARLLAREAAHARRDSALEAAPGLDPAQGLLPFTEAWLFLQQ